MSTRAAEAAYSPRDAAKLKGVSYGLIIKAIHATEGNVLRAKRLGKGYRISASALEEWFSGLDDA